MQCVEQADMSEWLALVVYCFSCNPVIDMCFSPAKGSAREVHPKGSDATSAPSKVQIRRHDLSLE
jgi:hypothetical protein